MLVNKGQKQNREMLLTLVDSADNIIGYESREKCHEGMGLLHRAFSVFIFNREKHLLIQKRSRGKLLWPLFWSNSVCGHPLYGEDCLDAARRRVNEELSIDVNLKYLFKLRYQADFNNIGSENEICYVFWGETKDAVKANADEIDEWKYIDTTRLREVLSVQPDKFTPWFILEWNLIRKENYLGFFK